MLHGMQYSMYIDSSGCNHVCIPTLLQCAENKEGKKHVNVSAVQYTPPLNRWPLPYVWRGVYTAIIDMLVFILCFLHVAAILRCKENVVGHRVAVLCNFNVN